VAEWASVYQAEDTKLDRIMAIKVLPAAVLSSQSDRARFYREAKAAAALTHPNIAIIHGMDEAVPEAASYMLFIVNPENLHVVNTVRTNHTFISDLGAVANENGSTSDLRLEVWVVAFGAADKFIRCSVRSSYYAP